MAWATFGLSELSGKTARTPSRRIWSVSFATAPAEAWACVVCDGMTAPITRMP